MNAQFPASFDHKDPLAGMAGGNAMDTGALAGSAPASAGYGYGAGGYGNTSGGDSELSIIQYLQVLYRRRHVALAAFLMVFLGASLYTFTAVRIYESTVR
ncbi:MAG TPA: hypothetical protein VHJ58_18200, partial [Vicinamibacterales bacterium]|nr:hypothetical protein [Vicinamibacterales bacterium]